MKDRRTVPVLAALLVLIPVTLLAGLFLGTEKLPVTDCIQALFHPEAVKKYYRIIVVHLRLPRTVLAMISGALLAGSGAVFQGFFKSSLADSGMLGVSSGAALGAVLGSLAGALIHVSAFLGAVASIVLVYAVSGGRRTRAEPMRLLLAGCTISTFLSSITSLIIILSSNELRKMYAWTLGSFNGKGITELRFIAVPAVISCVLFLFCIKPLDILAAGDLSAQAMGVSLKKTRFFCFAAGSLAAASAVAAGGVIGFVGLIAPHTIRMLCGASYKKVLPFSMLLGAVFLGWADILCRTIKPPLDLPIGILTALCGVPFFMAVLMGYSRRYTA
ncbi:MAG: iron ABC transporter permease [Treponemataceae bacterium]|nr:iron ABC transporter permease [Treponemataceae bacterium]